PRARGPAAAVTTTASTSAPASPPGGPPPTSAPATSPRSPPSRGTRAGSPPQGNPRTVSTRTTGDPESSEHRHTLAPRTPDPAGMAAAAFAALLQADGIHVTGTPAEQQAKHA